MNKRSTKARDMKWRIKLQRRADVVSRTGGRSEGWIDYKTVWARVSESGFAYQRTGDAPHGYSFKDFTIHYDDKVNLKDFCVVYDGRRYRLSTMKRDNAWDRNMTLTGEANLLEDLN